MSEPFVVTDNPIADYYHHIAWMHTHMVQKAMGRLSSPLEHKLLPYLSVLSSDECGRGPFTPRIMYHVDYDDVEFSRFHSARYPLLLFVQAPIGRYKADFLLVLTRARDSSVHKIVIECDGHDFHEKTKGQARHDRSRDRFMTANGYKVFRFTGSEIHADPSCCSREISSYIDTLTFQGV